MTETALSMRAKYNSTCPSCGQPIVAGDVMALHNRRAYCSASCLPEGVAIVNRTEREHPNDRRERHRDAEEVCSPVETPVDRIERMHEEKMAALQKLTDMLHTRLTAIEVELHGMTSEG